MRAPAIQQVAKSIFCCFSTPPERLGKDELGCMSTFPKPSNSHNHMTPTIIKNMNLAQLVKKAATVYAYPGKHAGISNPSRNIAQILQCVGIDHRYVPGKHVMRRVRVTVNWIYSKLTVLGRVVLCSTKQLIMDNMVANLAGFSQWWRKKREQSVLVFSNILPFPSWKLAKACFPSHHGICGETPHNVKVQEAGRE